jgi:hypothetical protein
VFIMRCPPRRVGSAPKGHTPGACAADAAVRRYRAGIGGLTWAAPQDWMCEPIVVAGGRAGRITFAGTGLSVAEHQRRTVTSVIQLRTLAPDVWWLPVLQGYTTAEYLRCADMYAAAGISLAAEPLVGLGSVCRRQSTVEAEQIITALHAAGITRLHGFGIKTLGLRRYGHLLDSSDSLAWSDDARRRKHPMPGCPAHRPACPPRCRAYHKNCANCLRWVLHWRQPISPQLRGQATRGPPRERPDPAEPADRPARRDGTGRGSTALAAHRVDSRRTHGRTVPPPRWAAPGLIAEGVNLLAGPPKVGKSWLSLGLALAVAAGAGDDALGSIPTQAGAVLYLALEDTPHRLQARMRRILGTRPAPRGLTLATMCPSLPEGGTAAIARWLDRNPAARMVVIDVFAKVRGRAAPALSAYDADYAAIGQPRS